MNPIDWPDIIRYLEAKPMTQQQIADAAKLSSSGHVSNLKSGTQKTIEYTLGCNLMDLYLKEKRRRERANRAKPARGRR